MMSYVLTFLWMIRHLIIKRKEGYFIFEARCCNNIVRALSIVFYFILKTNKKCSCRIQLISIKRFSIVQCLIVSPGNRNNGKHFFCRSEPYASCKGANTCNISLNTNTEDPWVWIISGFWPPFSLEKAYLFVRLILHTTSWVWKIK